MTIQNFDKFVDEILVKQGEEAFEQEELRQLAQEYYRKKGEGRPTKKDRRDLDDFFSSEEEEEWESEQWKP